MRIPRIFVDAPLAVDHTFSLTGDAANHVVNVLRLKAGHPLVLFNGDNNEYSAVLEDVSKRTATVLVETTLALSKESPMPLHLAQGVSRGDRMDWVIQKSVELGVTDITPVITERCGVKLNQERWQKKQHQWRKILIGACEQCGRNLLPTLHPVISLTEWLAQSTDQLRLTLDPKASQSFKQLPSQLSGYRLLIGPEGGLDDNEIYAASAAGYQGVNMGPRILRTETAALAAITALQSRFGDI